jgi:hypothetical protein
MSEKPLPFVITDRRKFNPDGQPRETSDAPSVTASTPPPATEAEVTHPDNVVEMPAPASEPLRKDEVESETEPSNGQADEDDSLPAAPTAEQMEQSRRAFEATAERLDTAVRAANPGADHPPALSFESVVQSVYMQAVMQLGGGGQPGEQPQIDILGARQSIDMLGILWTKTTGNLSKTEEILLSSALFELRLAFLEMTQALARSAQQRGPGGPGMPPAPGGRPGPSIVR